MQLESVALVAGVRLIACGEVTSTNTQALAFARRGERGPLWVTARRQTEGRGRRGNGWVSDSGNLFASLLLTDPAPPAQVAQLSFVSALAVYDAVADLAPAVAPLLSLKWPNDVLIGRAKVAGILIEGETVAGQSLVAVIGIGVNCASHPRDIPYPATSLAACRASVAPEHLFQALSASMLRRLAQWNRGADFASVRAQWLSRAVGLGESIRVRLGGRELKGRFEALDETGRLVLRLADDRAELIAAGEVFEMADFGHPAER
jgi:BirA family transcriptional regulator, biotin operon repressor / biotin---[acetyl-CoA-carboxylase] ligase